MNQAPTRKTLQEKPCKKRQIKKESFFRQKKDLGNGAKPHFFEISFFRQRKGL